MAKGNILLGMGRGKLGDIVLTRIDGQQIARPRNRQPKNPRTNKQLYQRAVMATVMQAYSAGIKIFDHSFEGKSVGAANQRYFMKLNAKKLRAQIAADIDGDVAENAQLARVVAPGISVPVPTIFQVSEGSLVNTLFVNGKTPASLEGETVAQYVTRLGIVPNDIFTFVCFGFPFTDYGKSVFELEGVSSDFAKQNVASFYWARYHVKPSAFTDNSDNITFDKILDVGTKEGNVTPSMDMDSIVPDSYCNSEFMFSLLGSFAWVRSRENEDLRSSESMIFKGTGDSMYPFGIISKYALAAWKQGSANLGNSDLILEGGDE